MRSTPIVSTTPRGNVLPNDYASIGIKEWCGPHGTSPQEATATEPEVRHVRQHGEGIRELTTDNEPRPASSAATGPDQEVGCGDECDCECPPGSC